MLVDVPTSSLHLPFPVCFAFFRLVSLLENYLFSTSVSCGWYILILFLSLFLFLLFLQRKLHPTDVVKKVWENSVGIKKYRWKTDSNSMSGVQYHSFTIPFVDTQTYTSSDDGNWTLAAKWKSKTSSLPPKNHQKTNKQTIYIVTINIFQPGFDAEKQSGLTIFLHSKIMRLH